MGVCVCVCVLNKINTKILWIFLSSQKLQEICYGNNGNGKDNMIELHSSLILPFRVHGMCVCVFFLYVGCMSCICVGVLCVFNVDADMLN